MTRLPHLNLPNIPQHVVQSVNNKQVCFFNDDNFKVYLDRRKLCGKSLIRYVIRNHPPDIIDDNISDIFANLSIK